MHFRQRVAWLLLAAYLVATALVLYYIFEMSSRFALFALEHADVDHGVDDSPLRHSHQSLEVTGSKLGTKDLSRSMSVLRHIADIPLTVVAVLLTLVYLQVSVSFC